MSTSSNNGHKTLLLSCTKSSMESQNQLQCERCKLHFHIDCLKSNRPSPLIGDIFFTFICINCSENGHEVLTRTKLSWLPVVILTLYNLQLFNMGQKGYFRWKEHICAFIEKHWIDFFGEGRKKTHTWFGTVAGTLSLWCPTYFLSGIKELGQSGWWKLANNAPPTLDIMDTSTRCPKKKKMSSEKVLPKLSGLRDRGKKSLIQAAIELKAKRDIMGKSIQSVSADVSSRYDSDIVSNIDDDTRESIDECDSITTEDMSQMSNSVYDCIDQSSQMSRSSCRSDGWMTEKDLFICDKLPEILLKDEDDDFNIDPCELSSSDSPIVTNNSYDGLPPLDHLFSSITSASAKNCSVEDDDWNSCEAELKKLTSLNEHEKKATNLWVQTLCIDTLSTIDDEERCETDDDNNKATDDNGTATDANCSVINTEATMQRRKRRFNSENESDALTSELKLSLMSLYEEKQLIKKLKLMEEILKSDTSFRRLNRRLLVREQQREHGVRNFNIDAFMNQNGSCNAPSSSFENQFDDRKVLSCNLQMSTLVSHHHQSHDYRILDRYQMLHHLPNSKTRSVPFINRLVGLDSNDLNYIYSPYTTRSLKPFIRRDYESRPKKLQLLQEIVAYHHRKESSWQPDLLQPIDFCYVKPQHFPSINALCKEFFWPGIDLSECLQYPDFSCVALYRKFVIGFAFMVPDVKYNESYISFIFTHPEWRQAGIGSFMLYHLIQTGIGKEITLHVSSSNPALLLYQKFGFKEEEFILDFYDKYLPVESTECRHAFFMRLRR